MPLVRRKLQRHDEATSFPFEQTSFSSTTSLSMNSVAFAILQAFITSSSVAFGLEYRMLSLIE